MMEEYRQRICALQCPTCSQVESDWEWLRYLKRRNEEVGDARVFGLYMRNPLLAGAKLLFQFVRGGLEPAEFIERSRIEAGVGYVEVLRAAGLVGDVPEPACTAMCDELHCEMLKAYLPHRGADLSEQSTCDALAVAGTTMWYRYVEQFHALFGLPAVCKLVEDGGLAGLNSLERRILETFSPDMYSMSDEAERAKYRELIDGGREATCGAL